MFDRQAAAVSQTDLERLEGPLLIVFSNLFDGHERKSMPQIEHGQFSQFSEAN
jgi:hypothetical protein